MKMGEENKEESGENKLSEGDDDQEKKQAEPKPPSPFVLCVDLHCKGCAKKIERAITKIAGVEAVVMDMTKNEVTIEGVVEPQAVCDRIMKKTKRTAKVLSPLPEAEGSSIPDIVASQASGLTTVELNVNMHCQPCAAQLKKKILKMKGVRTVETELSSDKVTVTGTMSADHLVEYVYRRTKKQAKIAPRPPPEPEDAKRDDEDGTNEEKEEDEKDFDKKDSSSKDDESVETDHADSEAEGDEDASIVKMAEEQHGAAAAACLHHDGVMTTSCYYQPLYAMERVSAPQMFSDENPNACCIA